MIALQAAFKTDAIMRAKSILGEGSDAVHMAVQAVTQCIINHGPQHAGLLKELCTSKRLRITGAPAASILTPTPQPKRKA